MYNTFFSLGKNSFDLLWITLNKTLISDIVECLTGVALLMVPKYAFNAHVLCTF